MAVKKTPAKRKRVLAPRSRTIAGKRVPFAPDRAEALLETTHVASVIESIKFWISRLQKLECPSCNTRGSLECTIVAWGIEIDCGRERCRFSVEHVYE